MNRLISSLLIFCGTVLLIVPGVLNDLMVARLSRLMGDLGRSANLRGDTPPYYEFILIASGILMIGMGFILELRTRSENRAKGIN